MIRRLLNDAATIACAAFLAAPAAAEVVLITQAKALAGNVSQGDNPGFPVSLTQPGSYRLDSNLEVPANLTGIAINSPDVTVDLNGFHIDGNDVGSYGLTGTATAHAITVRNGTIRAFTFDGILGNGEFWVVEDVRALNNHRDGIGLASSDWARIINSLAVGNTRDGIRCGSSCFVEANQIARNSNGLTAGTSAIALHNIITENTLDGIRSVSGVIEGNNISLNGARGLVGGTAVLGNAISNNYSYGISGDPAGTGYANNRLYNNGYGGSGVGNARNVLPMHPNLCSSGACP
jgi:hypothetical protein